jgi:hypothetical protein
MNPDNIHQKSLSSFLLGGISILLEVIGLIMLLFGKWIISLLLVSCGIAVSHIAYKKAGGKLQYSYKKEMAVLIFILRFLIITICSSNFTVLIIYHNVRHGLSMYTGNGQG